MIGFIHYIRFSDGDQVNFGYQWDNDSATGKNWRYTGYKAIAGILIKLPWEVRLTSNAEYQARFYPGQNSVSGKHRKDQQPTVLTSLSKDITPNLTANFQYFFDRNMSTITDFNIRREVYALGVTWRY
jgi:hypothetical protein